MVHVGYHASQEQFTPRELIDYVRLAEQAGFNSIMSSDHLAPWSERQGQSAFVWTWLGAAMQLTKLPFGLITVPSGWRYHPVITAQAAATLAQLFPNRFPWMAVGSGQALNEHVVGDRWPSKAERNARLIAGVEIIRALWSGETVSSTEPVKVDEAKLYALPDRPPLIIAGALSTETAEWAGGWADGLITINQPREKIVEIIDAFRRGGGEGKPLYLQAHISYAPTEENALLNAFDQWRSNAVTAAMAETMRSPKEFDEACVNVRPEDMHRYVRIASDIGQHRAWIEEDAAIGFEKIYVHNVGRNQREFIKAFAQLLSALS
ncbi:TIGR03885 family FMN-dependent LLM class oxidoreductase [Rhizobium sullae]|uniref:Putative non-F420 flavinoid oxidoreductase n=1 Tax=Rhizobium sullae TaxID=50338 RepID=A0A4R3PRQ5_RHISU|nr:TIGR03885 family FMN-dependent LLM class oxidoreductase [Rhizobium sullae]TCU07031.1 putative non-F420 flavinoid oxidoreductase [Rhizobium sullae]